MSGLEIKTWWNTLKFEQMGYKESLDDDDDEVIPWIAASKSSDQKPNYMDVSFKWVKLKYNITKRADKNTVTAVDLYLLLSIALQNNFSLNLIFLIFKKINFK